MCAPSWVMCLASFDVRRIGSARCATYPKQEQRADVANSALERGLSELSAIQEADAVVRHTSEREDQ